MISKGCVLAQRRMPSIGVHFNGEYASDGAGGWRKPFMRSYVGGGTGVFVPIQGWYHVASGLFDVVMVVAEEKMSSYYPHAQAAFLTIFDHTTERPLKPNLLWIFALEMNRYMTTYGISKADIAQVAVQHKRNTANHPAALLGDANITVKDMPRFGSAGMAGAALRRQPRVGWRGGGDPGSGTHRQAHY